MGKGQFKKGHIPWNKGLTKETDERLAKIGEKNSEFQTGKTWEVIYGVEKSKEMRKQRSQRTVGKNNPFYGKRHSLKAKKQMRESWFRWWNSLSESEREEINKKKGQHPTPSKRIDVRKKISGTRSSRMAEGKIKMPPTVFKNGHRPFYPKLRFCGKLNHKVRSKTEEQVCKILVAKGIEYEYEKSFNLADGRRYYADITIEDKNIVIEIKGDGFFIDEKAKAKYKEFMNTYTEYDFWIISPFVEGIDEICDKHLNLGDVLSLGNVDGIEADSPLGSEYRE